MKKYTVGFIGYGNMTQSDRCGACGQGVKYLNENRFEDITIEAIKRTIARAEEMGKTNEER